MGDFLFLFRFERHGACALALFQNLFVAREDIVGQLRLLVAARLCLFLDAGYTAINGFEVFYLKLHVDNLLVAHGIDRTIDVYDIIIVEAAEDMDNRVRLADIRQELVAQTFALACPFHETGDINDFDRRRDDAFGMYQFGEAVQPFVGDGDDTHVRFDSTKRKVCGLRFRIG